MDKIIRTTQIFVLTISFFMPISGLGANIPLDANNKPIQSQGATEANPPQWQEIPATTPTSGGSAEQGTDDSASRQKRFWIAIGLIAVVVISVLAALRRKIQEILK